MFLIIIFIFIQIILESLPVSSSGHFLLAEKLFGINIPEYFDYVLHLPTIIILMIVFYKNWWPLVNPSIQFFWRKITQGERGVRGECPQGVSSHKLKDSYKKLYKIFFKIISLIFIADSITVLIWLIFKFYFSDQAWLSSNYTLLIGFCVTGLLLYGLKFINVNAQERPFDTNFTNVKFTQGERATYLNYALLGLAQGFALIPGISRFATVFFFASLLNKNLKRAFQITFLIQFPIICAGFLLGVYKMFFIMIPGLARNDSAYSQVILGCDRGSTFNLLLIFLAIFFSSIISYFIFKKVKTLAESGKIYKFAYYMPIPILILIFYILF